MNLIENDWTNQDYLEFLNYLDSLQDLKYLQFQQNLVLDGKKMRGIRTPILKSMAKDISKGSYDAFLKQIKFNSYEEIILYGLILSNLKVPIKTIEHHLYIFIDHIDNWAITDIVATNFKTFKKEQEYGFHLIQNLLISKNTWSIRFGLVLLLSHYINDNYIDIILETSNQVNSDEYYVKMANAWLLSICYIKYPQKTLSFIENTKLDDWTFNKAISKICDSYRVTKEEKDALKKLKRKNRT